MLSFLRHFAASQGQKALVERFILEGVELNVQDLHPEGGKTALYWACFYEHYEIGMNKKTITGMSSFSELKILIIFSLE